MVQVRAAYHSATCRVLHKLHKRLLGPRTQKRLFNHPVCTCPLETTIRKLGNYPPTFSGIHSEERAAKLTAELVYTTVPE